MAKAVAVWPEGKLELLARLTPSIKCRYCPASKYSLGRPAFTRFFMICAASPEYLAVLHQK